MHDRIDAQIWNEHHDQLSAWIDDALAAGGARLRARASGGFPVPVQLLAALFAFGLTALTLTASAA